MMKRWLSQWRNSFQQRCNFYHENNSFDYLNISCWSHPCWMCHRSWVHNKGGTVGQTSTMYQKQEKTGNEKFLFEKSVMFPHFSSLTPRSSIAHHVALVLYSVWSAGTVLLHATRASCCWLMGKCYSCISTFHLVQDSKGGSWLLVSPYNNGERREAEIREQIRACGTERCHAGVMDGWIREWMVVLGLSSSFSRDASRTLEES